APSSAWLQFSLHSSWRRDRRLPLPCYRRLSRRWWHCPNLLTTALPPLRLQNVGSSLASLFAKGFLLSELKHVSASHAVARKPHHSGMGRWHRGCRNHVSFGVAPVLSLPQNDANDPYLPCRCDALLIELFRCKGCHHLQSRSTVLNFACLVELDNH